jgi:hypothetical protein
MKSWKCRLTGRLYGGDTIKSKQLRTIQMKKIKDIAVIVFLGVIAIAWMMDVLKLSSTFGSKKDFWDILTALGTCAAAVVALFFGLGQQVQNRREAETRAQVIAARLVPLLASRIDMIQLLRFELKGFLENAFPNIMEPVTFDRIRTSADRAAFDVPTSDLVMLAVLPDNCATRLARAIALIEMFQRDTRMNSGRAHFFDKPNSEAEAFVTRTIPWADECEALLVAVLNTCVVASREISAGTKAQRSLV